MIPALRRPVSWLLERMSGALAEEWREEYFRALVEHSQDTIMLLDREGRIRYMSPGRAGILGYETEERLGAWALDIVHPDDTPELEERFARLRERPGASDTAEMRCRHKDGSWRWIEATGTNLLEVPRVRAVVVNYRDISARRHAMEQHAERLRLDGALLVARTAAHELNNALSPVLGFAELLALRPQVLNDPQAAAYVGNIMQAARQAAEIVQRLQNITRLEEEESALGPEYPILNLERSTSETA